MELLEYRAVAITEKEYRAVAITITIALVVLRIGKQYLDNERFKVEQESKRKTVDRQLEHEEIQNKAAKELEIQKYEVDAKKVTNIVTHGLDVTRKCLE